MEEMNYPFKSKVVLVLIGLSLGFFIGIIFAEREYKNKFNELSLGYKSLELSNGYTSYLMHQAIGQGDIEIVKSRLMDDYQSAKDEGNGLNLDEYSKVNWPFTIDEWMLKNIRQEIDKLNNPDRCKKDGTASTMSNSEKSPCNA